MGNLLLLERVRVRPRGVLPVLLRAVLYGLAVAVIYLICRLLAGFGLAPVLPLIAYVAALVGGFLATVLNMDALMNGSRDTEFLLSTPIPEAAHVIFMLLQLYLKSLLITLALCAPAVIVYSAEVPVNAAFWVRWVIGILLTGLPFGAFAAISGAFIALCAAESPRKNIIRSVVSGLASAAACVFLLLFADKIASAIVSGSGGSEAALTVRSVIIKNLMFSRFYQYSVIEGDIMYLFLFMLASILWYGVIGLLLCFSYRLNIISMRCPVKYGEYTLSSVTCRAPRAAIRSRQWQMFLDSGSVFARSIAGIAAAILVPLNFCIVGLQRFLPAFGAEGLTKTAALLVPVIICVFVFLACPAASLKRLSGQYSWLSRSSPVSQADIAAGESAVSLALTVPTALISGVLFIFAVRPGVALSVAYILVPVVFAAALTALSYSTKENLNG